MNALNDEQRKRVATWIQEGAKLSEIQNRIGAEFGARLTYMEVRFLVDDLKVMPKDPEPPKQPESKLTSPAPSATSTATPTADAPKPLGLNPEPAPAPGGVTVSVDKVTRPGAMVSGKVTFSDSQKADWYFDPNGRLGLAAQTPGYRPSQRDLQEFQMALETELSRMGY